ncbi:MULTISPECIES: HAD family phosphatase [unclassified Pseudomonas]|uniref:HAD family hydrolase n=1 Tax=unclassified Pseudomonas TaxID=196821 RepID=UPI000BD176FA|nr:MULTISPECIES: HAD family hydrolase [unclassified Pseudomonas]PVZ20635.1 HAD superfamily hydrolase (TIGR01490 family) [Pseudomonas sp. URIL14HWK12:I12]PVZ27701.1 HAD superfamily hydrolase (TIGR01490 family) [Pseudomonas sp. URIL14HWK12:I10]PVZ38590.1 HAD superfamily hydrolase (TIGR01490 family) [Pseudomonas sp. URIL14HWK12:I11]SNZ02750.1 HAD-superfamily subfamily IB hydrolase, TIGR01490 [Pseudomonas sp. URIL14HWK12:I9]
MPLAIFDLDDTLIDGDSSALWNEQMARLGWVDPTAFVEQSEALMRAYHAGELSMEQFMAFALEPMIGRSEEEIAHLVEPWVEEVIEPLIHSDATRVIAHHRSLGNRIVVISATARFLVAPIAARIGIDDVLAIDCEIAHGVYSGRTQGILTYREGKVARLEQWLADEGETLEGASFFSDSRNDLPLLQAVAHPQAVNPDPTLRAHAEQAGWPIHHWR